VSILGGILLGAVLLLAWTQQWFAIALTDETVLDVRGDVAAPAQLTLALSGLVLFAALSIAGPFFRVVLGVLAAALGALTVTTAVAARLDPVEAARVAITEATGVDGAASVASLVAAVTETGWPLGSIITGALLALLGIFIVITGRLWPSSSRKYQAVRVTNEDGSSVGDWDALSEGDDPTSR
jgi:hypothetical protein